MLCDSYGSPDAALDTRLLCRVQWAFERPGFYWEKFRKRSSIRSAVLCRIVGGEGEKACVNTAGRGKLVLIQLNGPPETVSIVVTIRRVREIVTFYGRQTKT